MSNGGNMENDRHGDANCSSAHLWVSSVAVCRGSDLAASGAANGVACLWAVESDNKGIQPLFSYSLVWFKFLMLSLKFLAAFTFYIDSVKKKVIIIMPAYCISDDLQAGFINSLAFAKSARFLVAGVGQEPRLGRWGHVRNARNGVAIHPIRLKEDQTTIL
ncbi:unnamed protein product [Musa acuminata var. zebrina]